MRDTLFGGLSMILAGIAIAVGIVWAVGNAANSSRYSAVAVGDLVAVVDERTGSVQTFERSKQPPYGFSYLATDSRAASRERADAATGGKAAPAKPAGTD